MKKIIVSKAQGKIIDNVLKRSKKDKTREPLTYIQHIDTFLYATDGKIAVVMMIEDTAEKPIIYKIYSITTLGKSASELLLEEQFDIQYPDITRCIDTQGKEKHVLKTEFTIESKPGLSKVLASCALPKLNCCVSLELVECFYRLELEFTTLNFYETKGNAMLFYEFIAKDIQIICMPLLLN